MQENVITVQRQYKDRLFRRAFQEKEHLLALYNAVNGSAYEDPEQLEIRTLEDVIYLGMKNDVAFLLDAILNLYEHQGSFNPNMPIRGLGYFSRLYQEYISEHQINVYSSRLQRLPFSQYVVFYNGTRDEPDRTELRLSDAFLPEKSRAEELLTDILSKNKAEVIALFLTEYDEQAQRELDKRDAREEGWEEGQEEGRNEARVLNLLRVARKKLQKGVPVEDAADMMEEPVELVKRLYAVIEDHPGWSDQEIYEVGAFKESTPPTAPSNYGSF